MDAAVGDIDGLVDVGGRSLYVRCTGTGLPTIMLEGGDGAPAAPYSFAEADLAAVTRTCVSTGRTSAGATRTRGHVGWLSSLPTSRACSKKPTSQGRTCWWGPPAVATSPSALPWSIRGTCPGWCSPKYLLPFLDPPAPIVADTRWDSPVNIENRDYLQVEEEGRLGRRGHGLATSP